MDMTIKFSDGTSIVVRVSYMQGTGLLDTIKKKGMPVNIVRTEWENLIDIVRTEWENLKRK